MRHLVHDRFPNREAGNSGKLERNLKALESHIAILH